MGMGVYLAQFLIFFQKKEDEKVLKVCENWASLGLKCLWEP